MSSCGAVGGVLSSIQQASGEGMLGVDDVQQGNPLDGDEKLAEMLLRFDNAQKALSMEVTNVERASEANAPAVQRQRAVLHSLESTGEMLVIMMALMKGDRSQFLQVFGGDCHRVAMMRTSVDKLHRLLHDSPHSADRRLRRSTEYCKSVEGVLKSVGVDLGETLAAAQKKAQNQVQKCIGCRSCQPGESLADTRLLLRALDGAESCIDVCVIVEALFDVYDEDGNGLLEDHEAETAVSDLVAHVMTEAAERASYYGGTSFVPGEDAVRNWVWDVVDKDKDKKITLAEAIQGFVTVVDDIDKREERSANMTKRNSLPQM